MTRTIGAAIGALIVALFMATLATRMVRPAPAASTSAKVVSAR
jgi:hypothetical protein